MGDIFDNNRNSIAALMLAYLGAMLVCFRAQILSGFDLGFGDRVDGLIEISILEHWRNVLSGAAAWNATGYFYPHADTLGYNDGYFLFGLVYSVWRLAFDPYLSDTLNIATFKTLGFFSAYTLVTRSLRWERPVGLLVAVLFTICSGMAVQAVHAQLQSIALLPGLAMLVIGALRTQHARLYGVAAAAMIGAWLMTAFYLAWFALFFAAIFAACWLVTTRQATARAIAALARAHLGLLITAGVAVSACALPFLAVYLPKVGETGGHHYIDVLGYLVTPLDPINVGPDNYVWGWIFRALWVAITWVVPGHPELARQMLGNEHESGFALLLFVLIAGSAYRVLGRGAHRQDPLLRALALALVVSWALTLQLWWLSPWGLIYELVPGAKGLRVVLRYQIFLVLPALLLVAAVHRRQGMDLMRRRPRLAAALALLLVAEQLTGADSAQLSRARQIAELGSIPRPPEACSSFYVASARPGEQIYRNPTHHAIRAHNVDAMILAERWRVPTLNGYATFRPADWDFARPLAPDYDARALRYVRAHALHGVCRLDMRQLQLWRMAMR